jgi:ribosomal protein S18 acetylase RimI-like enzyme
MQFTIRKAVTENELEQAKKLLGDLFDHENSLRGDRKPTADILDGGFSYVVKNVKDHDGAIFLVYDGDKPVGFATCWVVSGDGLDSGDNRLGHFSDAYICPEYRGQGLYHQLVDARKNHFRSLGVKKVIVDTLGTNKDTQNILQKCGFAIHKIIYESEV